jgi:hypothetical protein
MMAVIALGSRGSQRPVSTASGRLLHPPKLPVHLVVIALTDKAHVQHILPDEVDDPVFPLVRTHEVVSVKGAAIGGMRINGKLVDFPGDLPSVLARQAIHESDGCPGNFNP